MCVFFEGCPLVWLCGEIPSACVFWPTPSSQGRPNGRVVAFFWAPKSGQEAGGSASSKVRIGGPSTLLLLEVSRGGGGVSVCVCVFLSLILFSPWFKGKSNAILGSLYFATIPSWVCVKLEDPNG